MHRIGITLCAILALAATPACTERATRTVHEKTAPTAQRPAPNVDALGTLAVHGTCVHLTVAGGIDCDLTGALADEIAAKIGTSGHPVRIQGWEVAAQSPNDASALQVEVASFSFVDGIYAERAIATGVTWRATRFGSLFSSTQTINVLEVDVTQPGVRVRPVNKPAGNTAGLVTSRFGKNALARAAVNGGYFNGTHDPVGLLKVSGTLFASNPSTQPPRAAIGFTAAGAASIEWVPTTDSWPAVPDAMGAGPNLVLGGAPHVTPAQEGITSSSFLARNPRTAVGVTAAGAVVLATVDGRSAAGAGMTLDELARVLVLHGCERALNLDGGGSTTMWIDGEPDDGVVSYPSDDGNADHWGERRVGNALVVQAP